MPRNRPTPALLLLSWLCSCGYVFVDPYDAGPNSDASADDVLREDATAADTGGSDTGVPDTGIPDGTAQDTIVDAPIPDGAPDSPDAGPDFDAGPTVRIQVTHSGPGVGEVRSMSGIDCGATCAVDVPVGTEVTLVARASAESWFEGWTRGPCSGREGCRFVATVDVTTTAAFTELPNRVFVSSEPYDGSLGGLLGADAKCTGLAVSAGLTGEWIAMLSIAGGPSFARLSGSRGFIRVDGRPVADVNLSGPIWYPIRLDENGVDVGDVDTWAMNSGIDTQCAGWTTSDPGQTARTELADRAWAYTSGGGEKSCDQYRRIYCAEIGRSIPIAPSPTLGRGAFVTTGTWNPTTGIAIADNACAAEASTGGRTGTYRAFLATEGATGLSRFADGLPWVRSDGIPLLPSAAAWRTATFLDVAPVFDSAGRSLFYTRFLSGARGLGLNGTRTTTCANWSDPTETAAACLATWNTQTECLGGVTCASPHRLLCLEE